MLSMTMTVVIKLCTSIDRGGVTRICTCDKMTKNYAYKLCQCQFPGFEIVL